MHLRSPPQAENKGNNFSKLMQMHQLFHITVAAPISCRSRDLISIALHTAHEVCNSARFSSVWIGRSAEDMSASYGPFFSFQSLDPNTSKRSQHKKHCKSRGNNHGKLEMGKRRRNNGLAGIMAIEQKTTTMAVCVLLHPAYLVMEHKTALTRTWTARKRSLHSMVKEDFPYSSFQMNWERSSLANHWSWSEPHDFSREATQ